jgi:hypothetical protein
MKPEHMIHNHARATPRQPQPGEVLFELVVGEDHIRCELRDHGPFGMEAQFFKNDDLLTSRRFDARLDATRTPRELAVQWAEAEVSALKAGGVAL